MYSVPSKPITINTMNALSKSTIVITVNELPIIQRVRAVTAVANEFQNFPSEFRCNKDSVNSNDLRIKYLKSEEKTNSCVISILGKTDKGAIMYRITHTATNTTYEQEKDQIISFLRNLLSKKYLGLQFEEKIGFKISKSRTEGNDLVYELSLAGNTLFVVKFKNAGDSLDDVIFYYKEVNDKEFTPIRQFKQLQEELKGINDDIIEYNNIEVVPESKPIKKPVINILPYVVSSSTSSSSGRAATIDKEEEIETLWGRLPSGEKEILRELHTMDIASFRRAYCNDSRPILSKIVNQVSSLDKDTRELVLTLTGCLSKGNNSNNYSDSDDSDDE